MRLFQRNFTNIKKNQKKKKLTSLLKKVKVKVSIYLLLHMQPIVCYMETQWPLQINYHWLDWCHEEVLLCTPMIIVLKGSFTPFHVPLTNALIWSLQELLSLVDNNLLDQIILHDCLLKRNGWTESLPICFWLQRDVPKILKSRICIPERFLSLYIS